MKLIATILAILIFVLTLQPLLPDKNNVAQKETCTSNNCYFTDKDDNCEHQNNTQQQKDDSNNCCDNGRCNPFEVCACCYYVPTKQIIFYVSNNFTIKEKVRLTNDRVLSSYIQDFWQPPEIALQTQIV